MLNNIANFVSNILSLTKTDTFESLKPIMSFADRLELFVEVHSVYSAEEISEIGKVLSVDTLDAHSIAIATNFYVDGLARMKAITALRVEKAKKLGLAAGDIEISYDRERTVLVFDDDYGSFGTGWAAKLGREFLTGVVGSYTAANIPSASPSNQYTADELERLMAGYPLETASTTDVIRKEEVMLYREREVESHYDDDTDIDELFYLQDNLHTAAAFEFEDDLYQYNQPVEEHELPDGACKDITQGEAWVKRIQQGIDDAAQRDIANDSEAMSAKRLINEHPRTQEYRFGVRVAIEESAGKIVDNSDLF